MSKQEIKSVRKAEKLSVKQRFIIQQPKVLSIWEKPKTVPQRHDSDGLIVAKTAYLQRTLGNQVIGGFLRANASRIGPLIQTQPHQSVDAEHHQTTHAIEVHVNLRTPQAVIVYRRGESPLVFTPVSAGTVTPQLIRPEPYHIQRRDPPTDKKGKWGLQYFAIFHPGREIGFHSNVAYPRTRNGGRRMITLTVNGNPISHGCVRMRHDDAIRLYNSVSDGTPVFVYNRRRLRQPSWEQQAQ